MWKLVTEFMDKAFATQDEIFERANVLNAQNAVLFPLSPPLRLSVRGNTICDYLPLVVDPARRYVVIAQRA
jgi:hypothetical protein